MLEDLQIRVTRAWNNHKVELITEIINPGSTNLKYNPFDFVPNNISITEVTADDINNMPPKVLDDNRSIQEGMEEEDSFGQFLLKINSIDLNSVNRMDKAPTFLLGTSLKYLNSTMNSFYLDFDSALTQSDLTKEDIINAEIQSQKARRLIMPAYIILRKSGYNHLELTI